MPLMYTSAISTMLIGFNLFSILGMLNYFEMIDLDVNKYLYVVALFLIWFLNHFLIVNKKRFFEMNFKKTVTGGWLVLIYIVFTVVFTITEANLNRSKVIKNKELHIKEQVERKPSLEEKVRKWFKETF